MNLLVRNGGLIATGGRQGIAMDRGDEDRGDEGYVAYLLRMWRENLDGEHSWRAVLQNAQTREEQFFADVEALVDYLRAEFSGTERGTSEGLEEKHCADDGT